MKKWLLMLGVVAFLTPALADQKQDEADLDRITELFTMAVELEIPLTDLSKTCPIDQEPKDPEYYSDNPDTQKFCVANPCHCF